MFLKKSAMPLNADLNISTNPPSMSPIPPKIAPKPSIIAPIICGMAFTNSGIACISPDAKAIIISIPA